MGRKYRTVEDLFPEKWLSPDDIGKPVTIEIVAVVEDTVHNRRKGKDEDVVTLDFGRSKRLILNKTQAYATAEAAGSYEFDQWPGTWIRLSRGVTHNNKPTIVITAAKPPSRERQAPAPAEEKSAAERFADSLAAAEERELGPIMPEDAIMAQDLETFSRALFNNRVISQTFGSAVDVQKAWVGLAGPWDPQITDRVFRSLVAYGEARLDGLSKGDSWEKAKIEFAKIVTNGAVDFSEEE